MHTAHTSRTRVATVLVAALSLLLGLAVPAFASDVDLDSVSAVCDGGDAVGLQYTARLVDRIDETTTATARIEYKPASLGNDAFTTIDTLTLDAGNGYSASGSQTGLDFGGESFATVRVTITDSDNPNVTNDAYTQTVDLTLCQPGPGGPFATFTICGDNAPAALLGNTGESPVEYRVVATTDGETFDTTTSVQPDRADLKRVPLVFPNLDSLEGRTIELTVFVGDAVELNESFLVDCGDVLSTPKAEITSECTYAGGVIVATLDNTTEETVTYTVSVDGVLAETLDVAANSTDQIRLDVADGTYEVIVAANGSPITREGALVVDCGTTPSATAAGSCLETGVIEVELVNPDPTAASFEVSIDGEVVETVLVAEGSESLLFAATDGSHDVVITADGEIVLDTVVDVVCGGEVISIAFEVECLDGVGVFQAQLTNDGPATTAQVLVDGAIVADVDVAADSVTNFSVDLPVGLPQVVVISDGETVFDAPIEVDCVQGEQEQPDPIVTNECQVPNDGVYTVTVENPGTESVEVIVTMVDEDGFTAIDEGFTVIAGGSSTVNAPLTNGTYVLTVTADGETIISDTVDVDCTEVLGITDSPDELPATGAATAAWLMLAMLLMFFGADVLLSGELRRRLAMMRA